MKTLAWLWLPVALGAAPFRVARVGELDGKVEVQFHAADSWRPAVRNTPLVESTWIRTAASAPATWSRAAAGQTARSSARSFSIRSR